MSTHIRFVFDYVDPGSYITSRLLDRWAGDPLAGVRIDWTPLELRIPTLPPIDPTEEAWSELARSMAVVARRENIGFSIPDRVPWTRKAHELGFLAREKGCFELVRKALFGAYFEAGMDIGRIDVLVEIATQVGLESAEARTVLGVDRFRTDVEACRRGLGAEGIRGVPTLLSGHERWEGFRGSASLKEFLSTAVDKGARRDRTSGSA